MSFYSCLPYKLGSSHKGNNWPPSKENVSTLKGKNWLPSEENVSTLKGNNWLPSEENVSTLKGKNWLRLIGSDRSQFFP